MCTVAKLRAEGWSKLLRFKLPTTHREAGLGRQVREGQTSGRNSQDWSRRLAQFGMHARRLVRADTRLWERLSREHALVGIKSLNGPSSVSTCRLFGGYNVSPSLKVHITVLGLSAPARFHRPHAALPLDLRQGQIVQPFGLGR